MGPDVNQFDNERKFVCHGTLYVMVRGECYYWLAGAVAMSDGMW